MRWEGRGPGGPVGIEARPSYRHVTLRKIDSPRKSPELFHRSPKAKRKENGGGDRPVPGFGARRRSYLGIIFIVSTS